jgi:hypothetical protein
MLQQCSSASSCMRTCIVMEQHYALCQHSTPFLWVALHSFFFFDMSKYTSDVIGSLIAWNPPSTLENSCRRLSGRHLFKLFRLVWWVCVHPLLWLLIGSTFTDEALVSSPVTYVMWLRNVLPSSWYRSKVKAEAILCVLCALMSIFGTHLAENNDNLA